MLNDQDINKLVSILATKKDLDDMVANSLKIFATKKDIQEVRNDLGDLKELV